MKVIYQVDLFFQESVDARDEEEDTHLKGLMVCVSVVLRRVSVCVVYVVVLLEVRSVAVLLVLLYLHYLD